MNTRDTGNESGEDSTNEAGSLCLTCCKPIHPKAKKCSECDSYQDWRRHLSMGSSVLALLVALVSVLALGAPLIKAALTPEDSNLRILFQGIRNNQLYAMVTNSGIRPGSIEGARLRASLSPSTYSWDRELPLEPLIIPPGDSRQLVVPIPPDVRRGIDDHYLRWSDAVNVTYNLKFVLPYRNFAHDPLYFSDEARFDIPFDEAMMSGGTAWHRCVAESQTAATEETSGPVPTEEELCGPRPGQDSPPTGSVRRPPTG